jgi:lambda repressor-like predicted transcriptional regulator
MHPAQIKAALEMAGTTQAELARSVIGRHGRHVSSAAVHHVVRGLSTSKAIAQAISQVTGLSTSEMWPGRYAEPAQKRTVRSVP